MNVTRDYRLRDIAIDTATLPPVRVRRGDPDRLATADWKRLRKQDKRLRDNERQQRNYYAGEAARANREYAERGVIGRCPKHDYIKTASSPMCPLCTSDASGEVAR
jgi:hypothetical protein